MIPDALRAAMRDQRSVLFLGAGASREARDSKGDSPPGGTELKDLLAMKFFGADMPHHDLMTVAEMAIQAHGSAHVFDYVRQVLEPFKPSSAHKLIAKFRWRAIATTNYDQLIERAYALGDGMQTLIPFVKDNEPIETRLQLATHPVQLLKLHGCLSHPHDATFPLVLSNEHYDRYSDGRSRLFHRLRELGHESPIIFCGYRVGDPHIRNIIYRLAPKDSRPAYYIVSPSMLDAEKALWASNNVSVIDATFGSFMTALDVAIPDIQRALVVAPSVVLQPIRRHFKTNSQESEAAAKALREDLTLVRQDMEHSSLEPREFYRGVDVGWSAISQDLDASRKVVQDLLYQAVIDETDATAQRLFVVKGPAGNGKTIALKRASWEAASLGMLVLWLNEGGALNPDVFAELAALAGKRLFLFVDRIAIHQDKVATLLKVSKSRGVAITIIGAERDSEWNVYCGALQAAWTPVELRLKHMSPNEVGLLVDLLAKHRSLGLLEGKPREEQIKEFTDRSDSQLLVVLHEVTRGKKFEDIVYDEYLGVVPEQARRLYLDICTFNQFAVPIRAGSISRISNIRFRDYEREFLKPLENVVLTARDPTTGDYQYRARHARVASMVFRQACSTDADKVRQLIRLISGLDIGFSVDRHALEQITRGRSLAEQLADIEAGRDIYSASLNVAPKEAFLLQQWAIFESTHRHGSLKQAEEYANQARDLEKRSKSIMHTQAEIARKRANEEKSPILKEQFRRQARERLNEMRVPTDRFVVSTKCKLLVDEVEDFVDSVPNNGPSHHDSFFAEKVKDAEDVLKRALQLFPDDADIIQVEARFRQILEQEDRALRALERALIAGPRTTGVAIRLSIIYAGKNDFERAEKTLRDALERAPDDKPAHLELAKLLLQIRPRDGNVSRHLEKSYTKGDRNFDARFLHAQHLLMEGKIEDAQILFADIDAAAPLDFRVNAPRDGGVIGRLLPRFQGHVLNKQNTFCFIRTPAYPSNVYANYANSEDAEWDSISVGAEITFKMAFSRRGPLATDLRRIQ